MMVGGKAVGVGTGTFVMTAVAAGVGVSRKRTAVGGKMAVAANSVGTGVVS
jgi:hypothetical protein